jgi:hypothetical protein
MLLICLLYIRQELVVAPFAIVIRTAAKLIGNIGDAQVDK